MWRHLATVWTLLLAVLSVRQIAARAPKFAIGEDLRTFHRTHHIEGGQLASVADAYHVYVKENTKELIVEPAIRVLPLEETHGKKFKQQADVCDYKILPLVSNVNNVTQETEGKNEVEDVPDEQELKRHRARRAQLEEDEYQEDDEEDDGDRQPKPSQEIPFIIRASKENKHEAVLESTRNLNCEHKANYEFDIVAVSCSGHVSKSARVKVAVEDVNEYEPKFAKSEYAATIQEGVVTHSIVQVQAFDEDCDAALYGKIQRYELIDTKGAPFYVDELGNIGNLRALNYSHEKNFVLTVVAYDAGKKRSLYPATVRIEVKPVCAARWEGIPARVDYTTESSPAPLYNDANLDLCTASLKESTGCEKIEKITGHVTLNNDHIGKGCDREDKLPLEVQRKRCSTKSRPHSSLIELLPNKPSHSSRATYPKTDSNGSITHGSNILKFDGTSTAIVLTSDKISPDTFNRSFTITTWLKREAPVNKTFDHKYPKESILCISDDHERSRHHVSVYVRNCRLSLLLRREPKAGDQVTVFRPAEWRWDLEEQLCGGNWHHYAISVKYPDVKLFIDGKEFEDDAATEIIDDWALHPIKGLQTTTVVGACWQGAQHRMDQFLKGYLDGLSVLVNDTEEESVLQCMQKCAERLTVPETASSSQAVFSMLDSDENEMLVEGYDVTAFQNLIKQIGYENDRMYPTPGVRFVDLRTSYQCKSTAKNGSVQTITRDLLDVSMRIEVAEAAPPVISLSGPSSLTIDGMENADALVLHSGMKVLDSLTISVMRSAAHSDDKDAKVPASMPDYESLVKKFSREIILLDMCTLTLKNDNRDDEVILVVSDDLAKPLKMDVRQVKDSTHEKQWTIQGSGVNNEIPDFLTVLRDVRLKFIDEKPPVNSNILLHVGLTCVEMFSKVPSAEYILQVDLKNFEHVEKTVVMHTMEALGSVRRSIQQSNMAVHKEHINIDRPSIARTLDVDAFYGPRAVFAVPQFHSSGHTEHLGANGVAITAVVVVCVAVLIVVVVVAILKIKVIQKQDKDHDLQDIHSRAKKAMPRSLKAFGKIRRTFRKRQTSADLDHDDLDYEDEDVERGTAVKPKGDMAWDDGGMSITINPLETMQVGGGSDAEYEEHEDDEEYERDYDESDEEPEVQGPGRLVQEDEDSSNECEECTKPNRESVVQGHVQHDEPQQSIRRSQSCVETVSKGKDNRMTRSELEWDDQI